GTGRIRYGTYIDHHVLDLVVALHGPVALGPDHVGKYAGTDVIPFVWGTYVGWVRSHASRIRINVRGGGVRPFAPRNKPKVGQQHFATRIGHFQVEEANVLHQVTRVGWARLDQVIVRRCPHDKLPGLTHFKHRAILQLSLGLDLLQG